MKFRADVVQRYLNEKKPGFKYNCRQAIGGYPAKHQITKNGHTVTLREGELKILEDKISDWNKDLNDLIVGSLLKDDE